MGFSKTSMRDLGQIWYFGWNLSLSIYYRLVLESLNQSTPLVTQHVLINLSIRQSIDQVFIYSLNQSIPLVTHYGLTNQSTNQSTSQTID